MKHINDRILKDIPNRLPEQARQPAIDVLSTIDKLIGEWFGNLELVYLRSKQHDAFVECGQPNSEGSGTQPTASNSGSYEMPADIKEKFTKFVANQKDMPPEFAQVVNDNFWDLI